MHRFLVNHREELIARCKAKVAQRPRRAATAEQLSNGIPMFLDQLTRTLEAEGAGDSGESLRISGGSGGDTQALSEMGVSAAAHGRRLLQLGFTVDQVVHDYGDLCQSITDLAVESDAPFTVDEFRTLNRCLDNAIADAVEAFSLQRDAAVAQEHSVAENERLGALVHELRNDLHAAQLSFRALESGNLPVSGATGSVLRRSLASLSTMLVAAMAEVRATAGLPAHDETFAVTAFIDDARDAAALYASTSGCTFSVPPVDALLRVSGNRDLLLAALLNLLQNAFKFTHANTEVTLNAFVDRDRVLIEVRDHCGGLPPGTAERLFKPFMQVGNDRSGLGLGLSIAKRSVEASGGFLRVQDVPGTGCVFTMDLARR